MPRKIALALAVAAAVMPVGAAGQSISYAGSASAGKLDIRADVRGLALQADMKLRDEHGDTTVVPRVTSSWAPLEFLDIKTILSYGDLNTSTSSRKVDTSIVVKSDMAFIDKIEASVQRAESAARQGLNVRFSRLDTGLDVLGGEPLAFGGQMSVSRRGEESLASSSLRSSWGLGESLTMQSVLHLDGGAVSGFERSALDSKLVYESPFVFIDRFEGEIHDGADGGRQSLAVLLPELTGGDPHGSSFSVTGKALIREILDAQGAETRSFGLETKFAGFMPSWIGGRNTVSLKLERALGAEDAYSSSLAYDHAWSPGAASIGLNVKMLRDEDEIEPSLDLHWSAQF